MGLFDKLREMKADHDAKKAAEAAELLALCNRLRQNEIFLNYADRLYETLRDASNSNIQWATGRSREEDNRRLAVVVTPNDFGLVACYDYRRQYRDNDGNVKTETVYDYEPIDIQKFADYGMQSLPNKPDVVNAVLETLASRLKEINYLTLSRGTVGSTAGDHYLRHEAINIYVSNSGVQGKRSAW